MLGGSVAKLSAIVSDAPVPIVHIHMLWSLFDNRKWSHGWSRFEMVHVDFQSQVTALRDSARHCSEVIARRALRLISFGWTVPTLPSR